MEILQSGGQVAPEITSFMFSCKNYGQFYVFLIITPEVSNLKFTLLYPLMIPI